MDGFVLFSMTHSSGKYSLAGSNCTIGYLHVPVTRVVCEVSELLACSSPPIPMRLQAVHPFRMTTGGIDDGP